MKDNSFISRHIPKNKWVRMAVLLAVDVAIICLSAFLGLIIRFDLSWAAVPPEFRSVIIRYLPTYITGTLAVFLFRKMYDTVWSAAGVREALNIVATCGIAALLQTGGMMLLQFRVPRSYYLISFVVLCGAVLAVRLSYRIWNSLFGQGRRGGNGKRIMIVGAGTSGTVILKEIHTSSFVNDTVVCFVDDDKNKVGKILNGVPIEGTRDDIPRLAGKYRVDEIYIAMPAAPAQARKEIIDICQKTGCRVKTLPGIYQLINDEVSVSKLREVQIEDLLGREPIHVDLDEIIGYVSGKTILVTGGGGSIGSELCRQIAGHNPKRLVIFDVYENNAYDIQQELKKSHPELDLVVLIGSVRNTHRMESVFAKYRPDIVYHAAAHKHVPLMEDSPCEAVKNNVFGTYKTAKAADKYGAKRFVLISTDKAVNPTNIMGASKRLCEMVIQMMDARSETDFVAVRFGNVLGSNGSVIPLFKKQIEAGDGDAPGHHPVLHDNPGGGEPCTAGRGICEGRGDLRAGHGEAGEDPGLGGEPDKAFRI